MVMGRRRGLLAALLVFVFLATGCKVNSTVAVTVDDDGTGLVKLTVVLDPDAIAAVEAGATLEERVRLDDVREAGWKVSRWRRLENGNAQITFRKTFAGEAELVSVLAELDGGAFLGDVELVRDRGLLRSSDGLRVTVDLSSIESGVAGDAGLAERLATSGIDVAAVDASLTEGLAGVLTVALRLKVRDQVEVVRVAPGKQGTAEVQGSALQWDRVIWLGLGAVSALLAGILLLATLMGRRRRRRRRIRAADPVPTW